MTFTPSRGLITLHAYPEKNMQLSTLMQQLDSRYSRGEIAAALGLSKPALSLLTCSKGEPSPRLLAGLHALLEDGPQARPTPGKPPKQPPKPHAPRPKPEPQPRPRRAISPAHGMAAFTFIDLFAGIGGLRRAFENIGGACIFTSEWDKYAQHSYKVNYPDDADAHDFAGDITKVEAEDIPDHDVLLAGFPCQPFSSAGIARKNQLGRAHGFEDETQGTLFFDVARIIAAKRPKAFLLENVKNLMSHDKGKTFEVIVRTLRDELGYHIHYRLLDGAHFVPQHRERILIAGFREDVAFSWDALPLPEQGTTRLRDILHRTDGSEPFLEHDGNRFFDHATRQVPEKYTLTDNLWNYLQAHAQKHRERGNGFGYGLVTPDDLARTLSARYYKDGSEILLDQGEGCPPRKLTPRECARLMGFDDDFVIDVSDTRAYKQFGNSVVVGAMEHAARLMKRFIV